MVNFKYLAAVVHAAGAGAGAAAAGGDGGVAIGAAPAACCAAVQWTSCSAVFDGAASDLEAATVIVTRGDGSDLCVVEKDVCAC